MTVTTKAQSSFPTGLPIEQANVEWQRDVYRILDLRDNANAGLGASNIPNLFTILFEMAVEEDVPVYEYVLNGNEIFNEKTKVRIKDVLNNHQIPYRMESGKLLVNEEDIPTTEVNMYYLKETVSYDLANGTYRTRVTAICPVLTRPDDFKDDVRYPLFWIVYQDAEPFLSHFYIHGSNYNQAAIMTAAEFFAANLYKGKIYKVFNAQGLTLSQYCETDARIKAEQKKIEGELETVRRNIYTIPEKEEMGMEPAKKTIKRPKRLRLFTKKNKQEETK